MADTPSMFQRLAAMFAGKPHPVDQAAAPGPVEQILPVPAGTSADAPGVRSGAGTLAELKATSLAEIPHPSLPRGSNLYGSTKLFPDTPAAEGQAWFALVHGIAHESSVSFVAILQATRALRKGFESALYFYGPGAINCIANRGFPTTGDAAFPGETNINGSLETFIGEGGTVYCCRFGLALHGAREEDLIQGVIPAHPLDVQDAVIHYANKGAIIQSNFMV